MDNYDDKDEELEKKKNIISILDKIATWYIRIGLTLGAILLLYFLFSGKFLSIFLYIIGLIVSYFFGYFFMFFLDKFISN